MTSIAKCRDEGSPSIGIKQSPFRLLIQTLEPAWKLSAVLVQASAKPGLDSLAGGPTSMNFSIRISTAYRLRSSKFF